MRQGKKCSPLVQTVAMFLSLPECYWLLLLSARRKVFQEADKHIERSQSRQKYVAFPILPSALETTPADPRYETASSQQTDEKQELQKYTAYYVIRLFAPEIFSGQTIAAIT